MLIPRRTVRTSQPQNPVGIDWSNPITRGLFAAILPGNPRNMVDGVPVSVMSATGHGYGKAGRYYSAADGAQAGVMFTSPKLTSAMTNMTMLTVIELAGFPGALRRQFMTIGDAWNSPYEDCRVEFSSDPQLTLNTGLLYGQYPVPLNVPQTIGAVFRGTGGAATFINGKADGSTGNTSPTINTQGRAGWLNYSYNLSADRSPPVKGYLALYWDRDLSDFELKSVSENPWQIFEDEEDYLFIPAAGGAGDQYITPGALSNSATIYVPTFAAGPVSVAPAHLANSVTLYTPSVTPGQVNIAPGLLTNTSTIYTPTLQLSGALYPSLLTNSSTVFSPTFVPGAVSVAPSLLTNSATVHTPTFVPGAVSVTPSRYDNTSTVYSISVSVGAVSVSPDLLTNSTALYTPGTSLASGPQTVTPGLLTNTQQFYSATVVPGTVTLFPATLVNTSALFAPSVFLSAASFSPAQLAEILAYIQENLMVPTPAEIAASVLAALNATTIPVNIKQVNSITIRGAGVTGDTWGPV